MSEPTPLSAEEPYSRDELVHLAENMRHSIVQQIVGATEQKTINRLLATIDAQATEIAALKGALEELAKKVGDYVVAKERMAGRADYETYMLMQLNRMADAAIEALVLAGKEAQGG